MDESASEVWSPCSERSVREIGQGERSTRRPRESNAVSRTMGGREADASDTLRGLSEAPAVRSGERGREAATSPTVLGGCRMRPFRDRRPPMVTDARVHVCRLRTPRRSQTAGVTTQTHTLNAITREHGVLTESETVYNLKMLAGASPAACWITNLVRQNFSGALNLVDFNLARSLNTATAECAPSRSSVELHVSNVPINCE